MKMFRLKKDGIEAVLTPLADLHWKVVHATELRPGDEVTPVRPIPWYRAKDRVNGRRTRVSPGNLVLLRDCDRPISDCEVAALLRSRPWEAAV